MIHNQYNNQDRHQNVINTFWNVQQSNPSKICPVHNFLSLDSSRTRKHDLGFRRRYRYREEYFARATLYRADKVKDTDKDIDTATEKIRETRHRVTL